MDYVSGDDVKLEDKDEQDKKKAKDPAALARTWSTELAASKRWMTKFTERARKCEKAYIDENDAGDARMGDGASLVNLFWSNVQVILAAIYGRMPKAEVDRRFKDYDDDIARVASEILQRILNSDLEREHDDTDAAMRDAVQDRFVSGMGQVWCRYDVQTEQYDEPVTDPMTGQPQMGPDGKPVTQMAERILNEEAETDYVYWEDFRYSPCRRWRDCRWVARRVYMAQKKLQERFKLTEGQLANVPLMTKALNDGGTDDVLKATPFKQAGVWEIWDRESNTVCWYVEGCNFVLDYDDDILQLDDFFPCPQPIVATTLTKNFLAKPDYAMAQGLYRQLDRVNARISKLQEAIKATGAYDKNAAALKNILSSQNDNQLTPVDNWSSFVEKGGLKGVIDWIPIEQFVNAITQLNSRKAQLQTDLYELLGISDIMRGTSVASETLGAQQLKVAYGGARLSKLQADIARFVSSISRIRAEIVSKHFQPETIKLRSLIMSTPDAPLADQAITLLKQYGIAMHKISVDADQLAAPDWEQQKTMRTEFMGACSNFLMAAVPMVQQDPKMGIVMLKLLQWGAAGFKGSRTIEGVLDQAVKQFEMALAAPDKPKEPSPEDKKNLATATKSEAEAKKTGAEAIAQEQANTITASMLPPVPPQPPNGMPMQGGPGQPGFGGPQGMPLPPQPLPPQPMGPPVQ